MDKERRESSTELSDYGEHDYYLLTRLWLSKAKASLYFPLLRLQPTVLGMGSYDMLLLGEGERASIGMTMTMAMERGLQHPTQTQ